MGRIYKQTDTFYPVFFEPIDTVSSVDMLIVRLSDGFYLDFNDSTFKDSAWTTKTQALTEKTEGVWVWATGWALPDSDETYAILYQDDVGDNYEGEKIQVATVDVGAISGDATAANNLELDYDGTGYAKANSTIGTTTANTDMRGTDSAATASALSTHDSNLTVVDSNVDAILVDTGTTIPATLAALPTAAEVTADVFAKVVDATMTFQELCAVNLAALAGKSSGGGTATLVFRDEADSKPRITATVDVNGNRTAITLDGA